MIFHVFYADLKILNHIFFKTQLFKYPKNTIVQASPVPLCVIPIIYGALRMFPLIKDNKIITGCVFGTRKYTPEIY